MGSLIEINDTLKISKERGFPQELNLEAHIIHPDTSFEKVKGKRFPFRNKDQRLYHRPPTPVLLVEEMSDGKWLYWGRALIHNPVIDTDNDMTRGEYEIIKIFDPEFQRLATKNLSPEGKSYF